MLEPEALAAAVYSAAGEVQALMNQLGLAARSAPTAKLVFEMDLLASLRHALQFGRTELVSVGTPLASNGLLAEPTDVVVNAKTKTAQLAVEVSWHPRGEDHSGFAGVVIGDILKMVIAKQKGSVEQATVLIGAPARFWRWLPGYAEERSGYELLDAGAETPASTKSSFLAATAWDSLFERGADTDLPERLWTSQLISVDLRSPWMDTELRLLEVKGLGSVKPVRNAG